LRKNVVVIGGGNSAMDAARTAKRMVGPDGRVQIVYRRTRDEMPADSEEIQAALVEGIELIELTAPECLLVEDGRVKSNVCFKMELGETDASGRPRPIRIEGTEFEIQVDSVISAIGQRVELDFFPKDDLHRDPDTFETQLPNVFAGGDAVRGASTLIKAIGDGKRVAESIRRRAAVQFELAVGETDRIADPETLQIAQTRRVFGPQLPQMKPDQRLDFGLVSQTMDEGSARQEARRCLQCDVLCNICTTVCPNRANMAFTIEPIEFRVQQVVNSGKDAYINDLETVRIAQRYQIINLGDFCNECGNCTTFCPTSGAPYRVKPKFYLTAESFESEKNGYLFVEGALKAIVEGKLETLTRQADHLVYETGDIRARLNLSSYAAEEANFISKAAGSFDLRHAVQMAFLYAALKDLPIFV
jgi:putative selenate reductase